MKRKIILIDEDKCNGCALCAKGCPEGALEMVDGKAKLTKDFYCDGLGACIGTCPQGAITIEEREAPAYDETAVIANIAKQGKDEIEKHLEHLKEHGEVVYFKQATEWLDKNKIKYEFKKESPASEIACNCPGMKMADFSPEPAEEKTSGRQAPQLRQWPVQLHLVPVSAPYLKNADLLIAADCVPFAYPNFHGDFLKGKTLLILCPKLDDSHDAYIEKLADIFKNNNIKSITIARMEVPCCYGINMIVEEALKRSWKDVTIKNLVITIKGELLDLREVSPILQRSL